jgi:hypothetical protein
MQIFILSLPDSPSFQIRRMVPIFETEHYLRLIYSRKRRPHLQYEHR